MLSGDLNMKHYSTKRCEHCVCTIVVLALFMLTVNSQPLLDNAFTLKSCASADAPIVIRDVLVMPDPVVVPGTMILAYTMEVLKEIKGPIGVDYKIEKNMFGDQWMTLSCQNTLYGSCFILNVCNILGDLLPCPTFMEGHIPCSCPIKPSNYIMDPLPIPLMGGALITGKYRAIIKANNFELGELLCYSLELEISPAPA